MAESISGIIVSRNGGGIVIQQTGGPPGPPGPAGTGGGVPSGAAGGVLSGTYPDPGFAVDMALQTELNAVSGVADAAASSTELTDGLAAKADASDLTDHEGATTLVHGIADASLLATKAYADSVASGLSVKNSVRLATAAALPTNTRSSNVLTASANGALTVDGSVVVAGNRVLVKNEATGANNGIYDVTTVGTAGTPFVLTRSSDADVSGEVTTGIYTFVVEGSANASTGWVLITPATITLNTTALSFSQFSGAGTILAGTGLTKTGSTIDISDPELLGLAGVTPAASKFPYFTGSGSAMALHDISTFIRTSTFLASGTAAAARAAIGAIAAGEVVSNPVTDNYTLVLTDAGKVIEMNAAIAKTITIPLASSVAFPDGTQIQILRYGSGGLTLVPTLFVNDTFTDTTGDDLVTQHTGETGGTWAKHTNFGSGAIDIQANRIRPTAAPAVHHVSGAPASADYEVEAVLYVWTNLAGATVSILGRLSTAATTYYQFQYAQSTGTWNLYSVVNGGAATLLGTLSQALVTGQSYTMKLRMLGTSIKAYVDGVEVVSATDSAVSAAGKAGVRFGLAEGAATGYHLSSFTATDVLISPQGRSFTEQYSPAVLRKRSGNEWMLAGDVI